jgi:hypothetical protein
MLNGDGFRVNLSAGVENLRLNCAAMSSFPCCVPALQSAQIGAYF